MIDALIMSVERDPATGIYTVVGDDGSIIETDLLSAGAARRFIADRTDLDDREVRSMVMRASPRQRRTMRAMLVEIGDDDGGHAYD